MTILIGRTRTLQQSNMHVHNPETFFFLFNLRRSSRVLDRTTSCTCRNNLWVKSVFWKHTKDEACVKCCPNTTTTSGEREGGIRKKQNRRSTYLTNKNGNSSRRRQTVSSRGCLWTNTCQVQPFISAYSPPLWDPDSATQTMITSFWCVINLLFSALQFCTGSI